MKMQLNRLAASASVIALAAVGSASALTIGAATIGGQTTPYAMANELNFNSTNGNASLVALVQPTTGALPAGNVFFSVALTNATFPTALTGGAVAGVEPAASLTGTDCSLATASISSGGAAASSSVVFLVSNAQGCDMTSGTVSEGLQFTGAIRPTGAGSVSLSVNVTTDPEGTINVDQGSASRNIITLGSGFNAAVTADTVLTQAALPSFTAFGGVGVPANSVLGAVQVVIGSVTPAFAPRSDYANTLVDSTDLESVTISVSGDFSGYGGTAGAVFVDLDGLGTAQTNERLTISGATASRTFSAPADLAALTGGASEIRLIPNGTSAILASTYSVTVTVNPATGAAPIPFKADDEVTSAALQSVVREGTQITLPWFASGTQAGVTGSNNLVRLGNIGSTAIDSVYANIVSTASAAPFTNPGNVLLTGVTIAPGASILLTSQSLEDALGVNWVTGDIQITLEALPANVTARRLVFNGTNLTEVSSGTIGTGPQ